MDRVPGRFQYFCPAHTRERKCTRTPIHLDDPTQDEEEDARDYAIHKIALTPRSQGPQNSLNLAKFSGAQLKKSQQDDIILAQVISWIRGSEIIRA
jgi:hypothetical protein